MAADPGAEKARREAEAARERFLVTAHELQARLRPSALAETAVDAVKLKAEMAVDAALDKAEIALETVKRTGEIIAEDAADVVRRRPAVVPAAVAGVAALVGVGLFVRLRQKESE